MMIQKKIVKLNGFSLLEVAISLCIIGIVLGSALPMFTGFINQKRLKETEQHFDMVINSLASYVLTHKHLPCPALPYDKQGTSLKNCDFSGQFVGIIPYRTLGLSEKIAKDGYGNWITYAVHLSLTRANIQALSTINSSSSTGFDNSLVQSEATFCEIDNTNFELKVENSQHESVLEDYSINKDCIAFIIISHGPKGGGSYQSNGARKATLNVSKAVNADDSLPHFVDLPINFSELDFFDDRVRWVSRNNLMAIHAQKPCQRGNE